MRKRTQRDIVRKAAPDLFADRKAEIHSNYVSFCVPAAVFRRIAQWLDRGDAKFLNVSTDGQASTLRLYIGNKREQKEYEPRDCRDN